MSKDFSCSYYIINRQRQIARRIGCRAIVGISVCSESIRELHPGVVAELKVLGAVEGVARADALGAEGVEGFDEEVFHRHVAGTDGEALDAVEVAVGQRFRAVAAEEGAVLEALVVDERIPRKMTFLRDTPSKLLYRQFSSGKSDHVRLENSHGRFHIGRKPFDNFS